MTQLLRPKAFLSLLALAAVVSVVPAQTYVEYSTSLSISDDTYELVEHQGDAPIGAVEAAINVEGLGSANGIANVGAGANKAGFSVHGTNAANPIEFATAFASSRYFDWFTIDDPALNGTIGTFTTTLFVHGSGDFRLDDAIANSPDTSVDAFWHGVINVHADGIVDEDELPIIQSAFYAGEWYKGYDEVGLNYFGDPLGEYQQEATFQFVYGQQVNLDTFLQTLLSYDNQVLVPGTFDVDVDLSHSAYWGGLREVRDASGNLLDDYGFQSGSGFDYRLDATPGAVPEPATMAALGLGALALLRRKRRA